MAIRFVPSMSALVLAVASATAAEQVHWTTPSEKEVSVRMTPPEVRTDGRFNPEELGLVSRISQLKGMRVKDEDHRNIGSVKDVIVDLASGRALGCIVQRGDDTVLVPGSAFFPVSEDRIVLTDDGRKKIENAPRITWQTGAKLNSNDLESAMKHFSSPLLRAENPASASALVGTRVAAKGGQQMGEILDLVADIPKGELVYVVVSPQRASSVLYAVPPQKLQFREDAMHLTVDQQHFLAGPKFQRDFWTEMALPRFASAVYKHYGLLDTTNTGAGLSPTGRDDHQLREAFLRHLVNDAAMPASRAEELIVRTDNGRIVLRGNVQSEAAHRQILSAAESAAGKGNVVDELEVR